MSHDDRVLRKIQEAVRAESEGPLADPRWDALARGDLDEEGRAALAELAAEDPALEGAMEAFGPLPEGSEDRFLAAITGQLSASPAAPTSEETAPDKAAPDKAAFEEGAPDEGAPDKVTPDRPAHDKAAPALAKVVSLEDRRASGTPGRRPRTGWILGATTALAAAAAIVLWVMAGGEGTGAGLPEYTLSVTGGQRDVRSDPADTVVLAPGARISLTLRPARSAEPPMEARAFLVQGDVEVPVEATVEVSEDGAVRMTGRAPAAAPLRPGALDAVVVIARPGVLRAEPETLASLRGRGAKVREARRSLVWRAP